MLAPTHEVHDFGHRYQGAFPAYPEEIAAIDAVNDEMIKHGYRVLAEGIDSPSKAAVFDFRVGSQEITEGPFVDGA